MFNRSHHNLSVGIVGAGQIVRDVHLPTLLAMRNFSVAWITDTNLHKARALARAYKVKHCVLPDKLTELPHTDVVLLAIPYGAREPYYSALRERSCALYVEKPFSRDVEHHRRICSWFPDYRIAVGFQRRSWGPTLLVKQLVEANLFGRLCSIRYGFGGPGIVVGGRYSSDIRLAGGGILFETGIHGIDALLFITSATAVQVERVKMVMDGGFDLHTDAALVLMTQRGERIDCEVRVSCLQETIRRLEFTFEHAVVSYSLFSEDGVKIEPLNGNGRYVLSTATPLYPLTAFQTCSEHLSRFITGVRTQQANWTSASQSILTTEVIEKLYSVGSKGEHGYGTQN